MPILNKHIVMVGKKILTVFYLRRFVVLYPGFCAGFAQFPTLCNSISISRSIEEIFLPFPRLRTYDTKNNYKFNLRKEGI